jgi:hypothetical protein
MVRSFKAPLEFGMRDYIITFQCRETGDKGSWNVRAMSDPLAVYSLRCYLKKLGVLIDNPRAKETTFGENKPYLDAATQTEMNTPEYFEIKEREEQYEAEEKERREKQQKFENKITAMRNLIHTSDKDTADLLEWALDRILNPPYCGPTGGRI